MFHLKVWSIVIPLVLTILRHNESLNLSNIIIHGGFVGCLFQNVCLEEETCFDDNLFGKCVIKGIKQVDSFQLPPKLKSEIHKTLPLKYPEDNNWRDLKLQCKVRLSVFNYIVDSDQINPSEFCKLYQSNIFESIKQRDHLKQTEQNKLVKRYPDFRSSDSSKFYTFINPSFISKLHNDDQNWIPRKHYLDDFDREIQQMIRLTENFKKPQSNSQYIKTNHYVQPIFHSSENPTVRDDLQNDAESLLNELVTDSSNDLSQTKTEIKPIEKFRFIQPTPKHLERRWVWIRFSGHPLNNQKAQSVLSKIANILDLQYPLSFYFLDKSRHVLYFHVPTSTGVTGDTIVDALNSSSIFIDGHQIEDIGFGRGVPLSGSSSTTTLTANITKTWEKYTITLVICLSLFGAAIVLLIIYIIQTCKEKLSHAKYEKQEQSKNLLKIEQGFNENVSIDEMNLSNFQIFKHKLISCFQQKLCSIKQNSTDKLRHQVITQTIKPTIEKHTSEPITKIIVDHRRSRQKSLIDDLNPIENMSTLQSSQPEIEQSTNKPQTDNIFPWASDPVSYSLDLSTGHLVLSYMEEHLRDSNRLAAEWDLINKYEAEEAVPCEDAKKPINQYKNRAGAPYPYEQSRVKLRSNDNDYINASLLYDHNPRNPVYIATITPAVNSISDFWLMVWEQCSVIIVCLQRTDELKNLIVPEKEDAEENEQQDDSPMKYWPDEGTQEYGTFEVHLVSEHSWCENYIVRSLYLKNLLTSETRTITQFHYLTWKDENLQENIQPLLEFRHKVNRCFRGMMSPIMVHCNDGCGRTGTYILLDLTLNRIFKGVREIDIAASLEHLRDQRANMVQKIEQYEFVLASIAQEVDAMIKVNTSEN